MKTIESKINKLYESIEMGLLTYSESMLKLRELKWIVSDKYNEGTDNYITCMHSLMDIHYLINQTFKKLNF